MGERRMMLEIVAVLCIVFFCISMGAMLFFMAFEDTDTFRAIDEKIAEIIRGKEE